MFHSQIILLREMFQKNGYPENFINRTHMPNKKVSTVEKKLL